MLGELAFKSGVLQKEFHSRLVANIENYARDAMIQPHHIWTKLDPSVVGADAVDYVRRFKFHTMEGVNGLAFVGKDFDPAPEDRMAAIAGALLRNFIRARVLTVNQVLEAEQDRLNDFTCLLIPNFFTGVLKSGKAGQAEWRINALFDIMTNRAMMGLQTVVHVSDMTELAHEYGAPMKRSIEKHFKIIQG